MNFRFKFAPVKQFLNILLATYIAFIACYPCNDSEICVDDKQVEVALSVSNHEHSPNEIDLCSPFCICNCCSSTINQPKYYFFSFFLPGNIVMKSSMKPHAVNTFPHSIWQPPRLA